MSKLKHNGNTMPDTRAQNMVSIRYGLVTNCMCDVALESGDEFSISRLYLVDLSKADDCINHITTKGA